MKFEINAKDLKITIEKVLSIIPKKASVHSLECIKLESTNNTLSVTTSDIEQFLTVNTNKADIQENGSLLIHKDDIKLLLKMSNDIQVITDENQIKIVNGKKTLSFKNYDVSSFPEIPQIDNEKVIDINESFLLESLSNMYKWTANNENNKVMCTYNFNLSKNRIEALDGHRIIIRSLENQKIYDNKIESLMLPNFAYLGLKKALDKNSNNHISLSNNNNYIFLSGNDFSYISRQINGTYFKVENMITNDFNYSFMVNTKELMDIAKYNAEIIKAEKNPMLFYAYNNNIYSYVRTNKYELSDMLELKENTMKNDSYIAFDPNFIKECMEIVSNDNVMINCVNSKAPAFIFDNDYTFIILPVKAGEVLIDKCMNYLCKTVA